MAQRRSKSIVSFMAQPSFESSLPATEITLFATDSERVKGLIERSRRVAGRVLWLCASKDTMWDTRRFCQQAGYAAEALPRAPLSEDSRCTLATYVHANSVLNRQHEKSILNPDDYALCVFDGLEDVEPSRVRELSERLELPALLAGLEQMSKAELIFYDDFGLPDTSSESGYSPRRWQGELSVAGWEADMRCYGAVKSPAESSVDNLKTLCVACPVQDACLEWCLEVEKTNPQYGLGNAAGMTMAHRKRIRRLLDEGREREAAAMGAFARSRLY